MAFYKVVLNGECVGQDVKNILWYRTSALDILQDVLLEGENRLAHEILSKVWVTPIGWTEGGQSFSDVQSIHYTLESIDVYGYEDGYGLVSSDPYHLSVGAVGAVSGDIMGSVPCYVLVANTKQVIGPGVGLPKGGYIAVGPVTEAAVGNDGQVNQAVVDDMNDFGVRLGTELLSGLPGEWTFIPIRVRTIGAGGVFSSITYKDVQNFQCKNFISFRKSRRPTG